MDFVLNKWGFFHFHCKQRGLLVFVFFREASDDAYVLDLVPHNGNWSIERHLVEVVVRNWPDAGIVRQCGQGKSNLSEDELRLARVQGLNLPVEVSGVFYLPANGGLMSDGSGFVNLGDLKPIVVTGRRYSNTDALLRDPRFMNVGLDPDDPRPPWVVAAAEAGALAAARRRR